MSNIGQLHFYITLRFCHLNLKNAIHLNKFVIPPHRMFQTNKAAEKDGKEDEENVKEDLVAKDKETTINAEWALLLVVIDRLFMLIYIGSALALLTFLFAHAHKGALD